MPTIVPNLTDTDQRTARLSSLRFILDSAETVDSYCVDFLTVGDFGGIIDREQVEAERIDRLARVLRELDAIVSSLWEYSLMEAVTAEARIGVETVERARALAQAIREAVASIARTDLIPTPTDDGEIVSPYYMHSVDCAAHSGDAPCSKNCDARRAEGEARA